MGFFISSIKEDLSGLQSTLETYSLPLEKIREYHGIFKSVCDNFFITPKQFEQIFADQACLKIWNRDKTDALQLFSGLVFFARECSFRTKLRFIFGLFDFNEIKSISVVDLEYMLLSVCNFTYTLMGKINTKADSLKLIEWLEKYLVSDKRVTVTRLYRLCGQAKELHGFLNIAGASQEELYKIQRIQEEPGVQMGNNQTQSTQQRDIQISNKLNWFTTFCQKLTKPKHKKQTRTKTQLNWVYGIQLNHLHLPLLALPGPIAIYAVSNKIVVYHQPTNHQKIYTQHQRNISCFVVRKEDGVVASAQGDIRPHIHVWNYRTLETFKIVRLEHRHRVSHMAFAEQQPLLAVACQRTKSPVLLFQTVNWTLKTSFSHNQTITQLTPLTSNIPKCQIPSALQSYFVISGTKNLSVIDQSGVQHSNLYQQQITALAVSYLNSSFPYLRYFHADNLKIFVVTGHKTGEVLVWQVGGQEGYIEGLENEKYQVLKMESSITQLLLTQQALFIVSDHTVKVMDLTCLTLKQIKNEAQPRMIKLTEYQDLKLIKPLNPTIQCISVTQKQLCILTEEGDLIIASNRQTLRQNNTFKQQQSLRRVNSLIKFTGEMRAMCFLQRQLHNVLLVVSGGNRIMQIDPDSHQINLVLQIGLNDFITVIDSAVSEEGTGLTVCGCRSGKVIIRNDWEEVGKVIQCGGQICDLKISPEGSTLLVATLNTLLFFHLSSSLSSPRKLTFENESPISLGFLDNSKFCAITTSAKNVYLLQLPSLKHRSVLKEVDSFAASRLPIAFPTSNQKTGVPSLCMVGGDIKFYLMSLDDGSLLFFPSMGSLQINNYLLLEGHRCPIVNLSVSEDQNTFYTLGRNDKMLFEWKVEEHDSTTEGQVLKMTGNRNQQFRRQWDTQFKKMEKVSRATAESYDHSLSTFFFRGTKQRKLNNRLRQEFLLLEDQSAQEVSLLKRPTNQCLETHTVYGLQTDKNSQVLYRHKRIEEGTILYTASRFLLELRGNRQQQRIRQCRPKTVSYISINNKDEVVWAQTGHFPWIWVDSKRCLQTRHSQGLIHFTLHKQFILSYGISENSYTINLHNYQTCRLITERTTDWQIMTFLMISQTLFVSLTQIRVWNDSVASLQVLGFATAGVVLYNGRDVCLGGCYGQLSVLCDNQIVEVARQAHSKEITVVAINNNSDKHQLITASLDQTIKIWNQYFQQILVININLQNQFALLHQIQNQPAKSPMVRVTSLDFKGGRVLAAFGHGQVWQYLISSHIEKAVQGQGHQLMSEASLQSSVSELDLGNKTRMFRDNKLLVYQVQSQKILDAHCSDVPLQERYITFDVHKELSIIATAGNDGRLLVRDYERNIVLGNYLCEENRKVRVVCFAPQGRMLVVGLSGGTLMTFYISVVLNSRDEISQLSLKYFQTFKPDHPCLQIISIQFNHNGVHFAVSYWPSPQRQPQSLNLNNFIKIYRTKSEKTTNTQQAFYEQRQIINIREEQKVGGGLTKCILRIHWQNINEKMYLIFYNEFVSCQNRYRFGYKGKYQVYCLEEKNYLSDQYAILWKSSAFPNLINVRPVNPTGQHTNQDYTLTAVDQLDFTLFCGGIDGRLHLVKNQVLNSEQTTGDYKEEDMCLSKVYNSHCSAITKVLCIYNENTGKSYVFTTAYGDQTLIQFQIIEEDPLYFQEHQPYPKQITDSELHGQCPPKGQFFLMVNNRQPLREQLTAVLQDVQKTHSPISLTPLRLFGRRAIDRRYNLALYQSNAIYSLGPNIIIQSLKSPQCQHIMKADPSPLSHCPQISTFSYEGRWLGIVTEEQHSCLYIWDIRSQSCLSSMPIQCSIVFMLRFWGDSLVILYGLNERYELVVVVVDWRLRKLMGMSRFVHSGNLAIRDICTLDSRKDMLEFITCGQQHLCHWQLRGDCLVYRNFNSLINASFLCVRSLGQFIVTGTQQGHLHLWYNYQLIDHLDNAHKAAVRCLQVDLINDILISGGKDGLVLFLKIEDNRLVSFNDVNLLHMDKETQESDSFKVELQIQSIAVNPEHNLADYQRILVGTRSGAIYQIRFGQPNEQMQVYLLFEGLDHQTITGVTFSKTDHNHFFTLSNTGVIQKWNIPHLSKVFSFQLGRKAIQLSTFKNQLLVCCRNQVMVYKIELQGLHRQQQFCIDTRRGSDNESFQSKESEIFKICLSNNGHNLAICIKICTKEPIYEISLYQLGTSKDPFHTLSNLKHEIDYLDFSTDDKFFLFKDKYEQIGMINLDSEKDYRRINTIFVEMSIEWQEEGLRISPHGQKIYYSYSCQNKITAITRLGKDKVIVGDQMGTIRIFQYPCPDDRLGELHLQCYTSHMNDIEIIRVNSNQKHVITTALQDRSLILWRVDSSLDMS